MKNLLLLIICCFSLILAGCTSAAPEAASAPTSNPAAAQLPAQPADTPAPTSPPPATPTEIPPTNTPLPPTATAEPALPALPADPQRIEFASEDGAALVGMYYPAAFNPAPVVVLMHWAGGDKNDWVYVGMASWLQNRGVEVPPPPGAMPFDTPFPFTPLPADRSFGVFLFDFRDYGESAPSNAPFSELVLLWLADARAAYAKARTLPGVDPDRVAGIGASIGADAVVDACGEGCLGAMPLGPGSYLSVLYPEAVTTVDEAGKPVWCVAAEDQPEDAQACRSASGDHYQMQIYETGGHAMRLFRVENDLQPPIDGLIVDFLNLVFNLAQ